MESIPYGNVDVNLLQCQPVDNSFSDLVHYSCVKETYQRCPKMCPHLVLMRSNKVNLFHAYKMVTICTEHGVLPAESNGRCQHCKSKRDVKLIEKLYRKKLLVLKRTKCNEFFNQYYLPALLKYRWHGFHEMILGKRHTGNDRQRILNVENCIGTVRTQVDRSMG